MVISVLKCIGEFCVCKGHTNDTVFHLNAPEITKYIQSQRIEDTPIKAQRLRNNLTFIPIKICFCILFPQRIHIHMC